MSQEILQNVFDNYSTNINETFYIPKKCIKNEICCGFDYEFDGDNMMYSYTKCNKIVNNSFVCDKHEVLKIQYFNDIEKVLEDIVIDEYNNDVEYKYQNKYSDRKLNKMISKINYSPKCCCISHLITSQYNCKCKREYYKIYHKFEIIYYVNSSTFLFKYFDKKGKLIFKGIIKDDLEFRKTLEIIYLIHEEYVIQFIKLSLEPFLQINKEKNKVMIRNNITKCKDILERINDITFFQTDVNMVKTFIDFYKDYVTKKEVKYRANYLIKFMIHTTQYYNTIFEHKGFVKIFIQKIKELKKDIKTNNLDFDLKILKNAEKYALKFC